MSDTPDLPPPGTVPPRAAVPLATLVLGALAGVLCLQLVGEVRAAIGAALPAAIVVLALWRPWVLRAEGVSYGRAAAVAVLATALAYCGAAIASGAASRIVDGDQAAIVALFSVWIVLPIMLATAIGIAGLTQALSRSR